MNFDELFNNTFEKEMEDKAESVRKIDEARTLISEKFGDINFIEESHQYFIDEQEYTPVSNIIKMYEPKVDWDQKAADYAVKYGRKKEDVQKEWKLNNLKSTISGTRTHKFGESYTNLMCGHPEHINEHNLPQYVGEYNALVATYPKEDAVKKFYDELKKNLHPVGAEYKLSTKYMENTVPISGTCDLLFYDSERKGYVIGDWKTNKYLVKDYNRSHNIRMEGCMSEFIDEPYSHYTLQFNMYQKMLESIGLNIVDRVLIWLKDDGTYETFDIKKLPDNIMNKVMKGEV